MKSNIYTYLRLYQLSLVTLILFSGHILYSQVPTVYIGGNQYGSYEITYVETVSSEPSEYPHSDNNLEIGDIAFSDWLKAERNPHPLYTDLAEVIYNGPSSNPNFNNQTWQESFMVEVLYHTDYGTASQVTKQIGFKEFGAICFSINMGSNCQIYKQSIPIDLQDLDATANGVIEIISTPQSSDVWSALVPIVVEGFKSLEVPILDTLQLPKIPYLVLHDPPGDGSFSTFEESQTVCRETSVSYEQSMGLGSTFSRKAGVSGSAGIGVTVDYESSVTLETSLNISESRLSEFSSERCIKVISEFNTSSLSGYIGDGSDIFIGNDERWLYGIFEEVAIVGIDSAKVTAGLTFARDQTPGLETSFILTAQAIKNDIDFQLSIANDESYDQLLRTRAFNQAEVWQQVLSLNEDNKANATEQYGPDYSFSGGIDKTFTEKITTSEVTSLSVNVAIEANSAITAMTEVGANQVSGGAQVTFSINEGMTTTDSETNSRLISYTLSDDDATDIFPLSVFRDPSYGTPIFRFKENEGGMTSCPYEAGYRIDQPKLGSEDVMLCSQSPVTHQYMQTENLNDPVNIRLDICNDSNIEREYFLELPINVNNANVIVNGETLGGINNVVSYTVPPNSCFTDTNGDKPLLTITRNQNTNVDHLNLVFLLYPACGGDKQKQEGKEMTLDITFGYPNPNASPDCPKSLELAFVDGVRDLSGNKFHGRSTPTTSLTQSSCGTGIVLGDNADDVVFLPGESVDGLEDFTIAFNIKLDGLNNSNNIISLANPSMDNELIISYNDFYVSPGFLLIIGGSLYSFPNSVNTLADLAWHHVSLTRFKDQATLFLDGVEISTITVTPHKLDVDPRGFVIGQDQDFVGGGFQGSQSMHGIISALNIFPYALEEFRIQNLLCATCPAQGTACDDANPKTFNDIEDGDCNCLGTPTPDALVSMHFENDLLDVSGNNMHGTSANPIYASANCGQSFEIGNNIDDVIFLPEVITNELGDFTISVNAKIDELASGNNLLSCANENYTNELLVGFHQGQGMVMIIGNIPYVFPNSLSIMSDMLWHHIVISRKAHEARLYVDGVLIGSPIPVSNKVIKVDPSGFVLGQDQDIVGGGFQTGQTWWGKVDQLRIFAYAFEEENVGVLDCEFCPLIQELDDNPITPNNYYAEGEIQSAGLIQSSDQVLFQAGNTVTLLSDFEVPVGVNFEVKIDQCPLEANY